VLTGKGVTTWRRTLADLIPAATPPAAPATRAAAPQHPGQSQTPKVRGVAGERDLAVKTAALLPAIAWAPFFFALATPGAAVEDEPGHLPRVAGVPANLVPAALIPAISALGYVLHRHG